jgi:hypothetical protein
VMKSRRFMSDTCSPAFANAGHQKAMALRAVGFAVRSAYHGEDARSLGRT